MESIPERREERVAMSQKQDAGPLPGEGVRVWRCRVCGYLCARKNPPETCPICKVGKDRFETFHLA